ncbi:hypothetical protein [Aquabacterium sp. J223]|uniref:hypothetical protein n=1 Tax=Aquabacterium sp. J223 TaxID=2898431 RepID=UPI0021ADC3D1|nr:hypothetical protein [Aquabacterium sp. J223]UUX94012.1 hypothetical protein LRS07_11660 [Aquabacterium sp. J223]
MAAPTLELSLHCDHALPGAPPNAELFPTPTDEREGLTRLVERLQARLGPEQVVQLVLRPDHRVECETRQQPVQPAAPQRPPMGAAPGSAERLPPSRPAWLLPQPEPLATVRVATGGMGGRPAPLWHGRPLRLLSAPERIEAGWWDGLPVRRDYHVAEGEDGRLLWIFFDLLAKAEGQGGGRGGWYLHGHFA